MPVIDPVVFTAITVSLVTLTMFIGLHLLLERPLTYIYHNLGLKTLKIVLAALIVSKMANGVSFFQYSEMFTDLVYGFEGLLVGVFQSFTHPMLTLAFIGVYLVLYPVLIILTYFKLHTLENNADMKYAGSYILLTAISTPFFFLFPVEVSGYYAEAIEPLLYNFHPMIKNGITSFDPLTKAMPSLHTGLSVLAFLYANKYTDGYAHFSLIATVLVIISTFYLGVHWISDAVVGAILATVSFKLVDSGYIKSDFLPEKLKTKAYTFLDDFKTQLNYAQ